MPVTTAVDIEGNVYVGELAGKVMRIDGAGKTTTVLDSGHELQDIAIDRNNNIVVAANVRSAVTIYSADGHLVRQLEIPATSGPRRVEPTADGVAIFMHELSRDVVRFYDSDYAEVGLIDVSESCAKARPDFGMFDIAIEPGGAIWVANLLACGDQYTLRKYNRAGELLGSWSHASPTAEADADSAIPALADIFVTNTNLYAVLNLTTAKGGAQVDVWTTQGTFKYRASVGGLTQIPIRARVTGTDVLFADMDGEKGIHRVPLNSLEGGR
ncbi:MAG: hypothetical protein GY716_24495 [bacterium]|nr:hypothetical protein [bacterium]